MQFVSQFIIHSRLFAASHSRGTKLPCWRTKVALGLYAFCFFLSQRDFALQYGGFVRRELLAAKGLFFGSKAPS